jgi:hypothetical protein
MPELSFILPARAPHKDLGVYASIVTRLCSPTACHKTAHFHPSSGIGD